MNPRSLSNIACGLAEATNPPSRYVNPFATCWTRPGALAFRFDDGHSAEQLVAKLAAQRWWGAIVGPHGSGKSTLLETLKPALSTAGHYVHAITLRDGQRRLPRGFLSGLHPMCAAACGVAIGATTQVRTARWKTVRDVGKQAVPPPETTWPQTPRAVAHVHQHLLIIDGYEQLGWLERARLKHHCRRANHGLLVTTHSPTSIPTVIRLAPEERLVQQLVGDLTAHVSTPITPADVAASHACHGSNVREILFDLYDRHERRRRVVA